ncbi:hypothetical protein [Chryseobacterium sp.]|uniref:hypothetical protein n=1 Tax=Chryseobacterium sp. TaxID=1871047 RepID=UPI00289C3327|nr:hypothetical protein [Chryseobacterium sp.]
MTIHFILPGETLQSISKQINLENPLYLKEFHNTYCSVFDTIDQDLVPGKKLFIPDLAKVHFYNAKNDAPFKLPERNPIIPFEPRKLNKKYRISVEQVSEVDGKKTKSEFSYSISFVWKEKIGNSHLFLYEKTDIKERNGSKMASLAAACIQTLNPLEIMVSEDGILLEVKLSDEVKKNFTNKKANLEDQFPDQYAKIYLDKFEFNIKNPATFNKMMKQDWFLKTYFAPFRRKFENGSSEYHLILNEKPIEILQTAFQNENIKLKSELKDKNDDLQYQSDYTINIESGIIEKYHYKLVSKEFGTVYTTDFDVFEI